MRDKGKTLGWISGPSGQGDFEQILSLRPELKDKYQNFWATFDDGSIPSSLLQLCEAKINHVHGGAPPKERALNDVEKVVLQIAEAMPHGYHNIQDEDVEIVRSHYGERATVNLLTATAFFDVQARLRQVWNI